MGNTNVTGQVNATCPAALILGILRCQAISLSDTFQPVPGRPSSNFAALIPELQVAGTAPAVPLEVWLSGTGDFKLAIAFAHFFWPDFVEHDKCILFAGFSLDNYSKALNDSDGDRSAVEAVMNHRHLLEMFPLAGDSVTAAQLRHLGNMLKEMWQAKLNRDFPNRKIEVHFEDIELDEEEWADYQITFWQPGNRPRS